jgi:glycosyltransferase involved in cell wall biosynthesis
MGRMKIAHVARWLEVGGTEQVIFDLCRLGQSTQWVVGCQDGPMRAVLEGHGVDVRLAGSPERLEQLLAEADVVNVHWNVDWPEHHRAWYAALRAAGRPLVFTLHGCFILPEVPGQVLCTSRRAYAIQQHNLDRRVLIPNGVDTERFRTGGRREDGRVRIIRVCRPIRCAEYFWAAVHLVLDACPDAELRVVGGAPFALERVESLGDRHDVPELLAQADIFAYVPWPHEGTRDLVVLEAMASGLACALSDVPCVRESVEHGVTGLLAPFGDAGAFADHLIRLVRDRELRETLGRRACRFVREHADMRRRAAQYEAAYARARAGASGLPACGLAGRVP